MNFFEGPCAASTIGTSFEVMNLVADGFQNSAMAEGMGDSPYLRSINQHNYYYYIGVSKDPLTVGLLMKLDNTEAQFTYWASQVARTFPIGLPYNLREMASVGPIGFAGVSDTFGASLWTLNFFLFAATLNIQSVQMHMTDNSFASPWQPIDRDGTAKYVRPNYYAFAAMAQLIGAGDGTTQVARLPNDNVPDAYKSNVRMYAGYGKGALTTITIINAMQANASQADKGSLDVSLSLQDFKGQTLYLSYLTADGADSTTGTVWNGMQYSNNDGTPSGTGGPVQTVNVGDDGMAVVSVRDSQAVIAHIGSILGESQPAPPAGAQPSAESSEQPTGQPTGTAQPAPSQASPTSRTSASRTATATATATASDSSAAQAASAYRLVDNLLLGVLIETAVYIWVDMWS